MPLGRRLGPPEGAERKARGMTGCCCLAWARAGGATGGGAGRREKRAAGFARRSPAIS
jgi:hypothetical protein